MRCAQTDLQALQLCGAGLVVVDGRLLHSTGKALAEGRLELQGSS